MTPVPPFSLSLLFSRLRQLQIEPGYIETPSTKARNHIVTVDEAAGFVVLLSERSRSGEPRTITAAQIRNGRGSTTNGVILRALLALGEGDDSPPSNWHGSFRIRDLLDGCIDKDQDWPTDEGLVYVVTTSTWNGEPSASAGPLYLGGTTGISGRFVTRIGDLIADMHGLYGETSGHSSGGQHLYEYAVKNQIRPGDLHIGWLHDPMVCRRCAEVEWHQRLQPTLNRITPPRCLTHQRKNRL